MMYYRNPETGEVFAYDSDKERETYGAPELVRMSDAQVQAHLNPPPSPEQVRAEALAYLAATDWYVLRQMETGEAVPSDVAQRRAAARSEASS